MSISTTQYLEVAERMRQIYEDAELRMTDAIAGRAARGYDATGWQAEKLASYARRVKAHINLIPLNHVEERAFAPSPPERLKAFCAVLDHHGANYTVRRSLGGDVDASCGQLRRRMERERRQQ